MTAAVPAEHRQPPGAPDEAGGAWRRRRTAGRARRWDPAGIVFVLAGAVLLGDVVFAERISLLLLGWTMLAAGALALVLALIRARAGGSAIAVSGGAALLVTGIVLAHVPAYPLRALFLVGGAALVLTGATRLAAPGDTRQRSTVLLAGTVTLVLGLLALLRWPGDELWFLATLLGLQALADGVLLLMPGRRPAR